MENEKVTLRERIAYGLTDTASYLVWITVSYFLMFFYTDVFGLSAYAVGTLFLIARVWDAINDPIMGIIIDKTKSKHGKCRPYFLWMAVPFAVFTALTFYTPNLGQTGKLIYAYVTYIALGMVYTAITIPVTAILPRLTDNLQERTVLGTFRMVGANIGSMVVLILFKPLYEAVGGDNLQKGFFVVMAAFGIIGAALFIFAFFNIKERIYEAPEKQKLSDSIKSVKNNLPWTIVFLTALLAQINMTMGSGNLIYFLKYNLGVPDLYSMLTSTALLGIFPIISVPFIVKRIGKRNTMILGYSLSLIGRLILYFFAEYIPMLFAGNIIYVLGMGFASLTYVLISDTVDYAEWKTGVRAEGFLSALGSFGIKLGTSIGGAMAAWMLFFGGYEAGVETQTASALSMIRITFALIPAICSLISIILLYFYKLDKEMPKITAELNRRRGERASGV